MCICKKDKNWVKSRRQIGTIKKKPFYGNKVCKIQPKYFLVTLKNCHRKNSQNQRKRPVLNLQKHYRIYCWIQSGISLRKPTIIFLPKKAKGVGRRHFVRCKVWELLYSICNLYIRKSGSCSSGLFCSGTWKPTKKRSFVIRSIRSTKLLQQCCQMCPQRDDDIYQKRENRTNSEFFGIDYIINILKHHFRRPLKVTSDNTGMSAVCLPITRSRVPTEAFWPFRLKAVHL